MCGLSVCFHLKRPDQGKKNGQHEEQQSRLAAQLHSSVESMRHRGPDAKGVWISPDNGIGIAHVRLATRDLSSNGNQPLHSAMGDDIHVVVNGELYYDPSLPEELAKDYNFQSTSDSEMAIALYRKYGVGFVKHLRGEFALVLYDGKAQRIVAARDRFGVKPLHYGVFDGRLLIATQAKGVAELLDQRQPLRWDPICLAQGGGHYGNRTFFEGIRKFPPGHVLVVHRGQTEPLKFEPYFQHKFAANEGGRDDRPAEQLIEQLRAHLLESIRIRLDSTDVPVGILLSGGVDSSAVAGMVAAYTRERAEASGKQQKEVPICFTIGFPGDDELDESFIAQRTAEHLGLPIERVVVSEEILANDFDEACWKGETLMWDLQHIAKKALSRHINGRRFKVVLNGDGSDELFAGYPFFVSARLEDDDKVRAPELSSASTEVRKEMKERYAKNLQWFGVEDAPQHDNNPAARALGLPPAFCNLGIPRYDVWLKDEVMNMSDPFQAILELFSKTEVEEMATYHPLHRALLAWSRTVLPNMVIAAISDGAEMAHSVESRPPFLDHIVSEFASSLPVDVLVHLKGEDAPIEKWIFREAVKPYVTEEVYARRKHAFRAPFRWKKDGPLYRKLTSLISREHIDQLGFVDWKKCHDIVDRSFEGDQLLFRQAIWLAQLISIGLQFGVQPWKPEGEAVEQPVKATLVKEQVGENWDDEKENRNDVDSGKMFRVDSTEFTNWRIQ